MQMIRLVIIPRIHCNSYGDIAQHLATGTYFDAPSIFRLSTRIVALSGVIMSDMMTLIFLGMGVMSVLPFPMSAQPPCIPIYTVQLAMLCVSTGTRLYTLAHLFC